MTADPSHTLREWIATCFSKLEANPDFFPAYQRYMLRVIQNYPESKGLDFHECKDCKIEPDEEESSTHGELLESQAGEFLDHLALSLKDGHSESYAEAFASLVLEDYNEDRVSASAYKAIGAQDQPWTQGNPGYQDVMQASLAQGKDDDFAHRCAQELPDRDYCFKRAFEVTEKYDADIAEAMSKSRSSTFAEAYAKAWKVFAEVESVALNYADCFEKLVGAGRSSDEADWIAYKYATEHIEGFFEEDDENFDDTRQYDKDEALTKSESAHRFRGLPAEENQLPSKFMDVCRRKYPAEHAKQWFDEMEALARSVLIGEMKLEDIPRSPYMEFLEQECLDEESNRPPRFDLMTDEEFKSYPRKSEHEQSLWEDEAELRAQCREMELDPTDPDDRDRYNEIINETRD